jgi:hypothetical protein
MKTFPEIVFNEETCMKFSYLKLPFIFLACFAILSLEASIISFLCPCETFVYSSRLFHANTKRAPEAAWQGEIRNICSGRCLGTDRKKVHLFTIISLNVTQVHLLLLVIASPESGV